MPKPNFVPVTDPENIAELANLADRIWREYFPAILTPEKLDYLLDKMLSTEVLTHCIADEAYEYYFIDYEDAHIGFVGVAPREGYLFLSKLYLLKSERGRGFGKDAFEFVKDRARAHGFNHIRLTCDRNNEKSLAIYEHMGFIKLGTIDTDMGNGYEMNDFELDWEFE